MTIDKINFDKLKSYDGKTTKCFEQLCYQIALKEYGDCGSFTAIDGSGGDGGVEFYLDLKNGERWGWQCKFFNGSGRLSESSRSVAIENSLKTAIRNHDNLTKWFLCTKTDLTTGILSNKGKFSKGERNWFEKKLTEIISKEKTLELEHWGETKFINFFKDSKHNGIRNFFFGELEFNQDWFKKRFYENFEKVRNKYDPDLHTIDKYTQSKIDFLFFDANYVKLIGELRKELLEKSNEMKVILSNFGDERVVSSKEHTQRENYFLVCQEFEIHVSYVFEKLKFIESCFIDNRPELLSTFSLEKLDRSFEKYYKKINHSNFDKILSSDKDAKRLLDLILKFREIYRRFFGNYFYEEQRQIHFIADAAKGKTHISCDIAYRKITDEKPAIFITGDKFSEETNIVDALRKILDIPYEYSFDDFLQALDLYGSITKNKIPIIIDGLNETILNRSFSTIWQNHLSSFISKILQTKNLVIITTCRKSYKDRIWDNISNNKFHDLYGFNDYDTIDDAVKKYFTKYKLQCDLTFVSLEKFTDPIFLKIFCEIKNPKWETSGEVAVNIEEESIYDVFNEYLSKVNERITINSPIFKKNEQFISDSLNKLSIYLWDNNAREIPIKEFYKIIDGNSTYEKDKSKADILIDEGLVFTRDIRKKNEHVSFTYDILAGFMIAESLIRNYQDSFFTSKKFIQKMKIDSKQNPLFEDVISALCFLLPQFKQKSYYELLNKNKLLFFTRSKFLDSLPKFIKNCFSERNKFYDYAFKKSLSSLFQLPGKAVKEKDKNLISKLFFSSDEYRKMFYDLLFQTLGNVKHPFNAAFFSELLDNLKMNERDISWTEYIRNESYYLEGFILKFETQCQSNRNESKLISNRLHLISKIIVWFLVSTDRNLRDKSTKALYYYGRKFPKEFSLLVYDSLKFNDPYIWERTLASMYGVVMAEHNSIKSDVFRNEFLPEISKTIYNLIFKENAPYSTTHILARDYARRIIEIGLKHNSHLLSTKEIRNIRPPYSFGGIRNLGEFDYENKEYSYNGPIRMDFSNYTIGRIVRGGRSYSNPPEKQKVRRQIYWRIFDLGWNAKLFKEAENIIEKDIGSNGGRTERAVVERYGKKYSWIAYFENAGLRDDQNLLEKDSDSFRLSEADINPSFPKEPKKELFFTHNLLGDETTPQIDWYENKRIPFVEEYLTVNNLKGHNGNWVCLDSYIEQENMSIERNCFTFVRGLIIKEVDYNNVIELLRTQEMNTCVPEIKENYYTFADELYIFDEATYSNRDALEFETAKKIDVLMPVMEYNWENYHSSTNNAGRIIIPAKEIVNHLKLISQPQTFDLHDNQGKIANLNFSYHNDFNNSHNFVYIRKDLFDKYLLETNSKFIWIIWGERGLRFKTDERKEDFIKKYQTKEYQYFEQLFEYKS